MKGVIVRGVDKLRGIVSLNVLNAGLIGKLFKNVTISNMSLSGILQKTSIYLPTGFSGHCDSY
jgi:hypothetical protein